MFSPSRFWFFLLVVMLFLAGCAGVSVSKRNNSDNGAHSGLEASAIAMYLPASHTDLQSRLPLQNFFGSVVTRDIDTCIKAHGFTVRYPFTPQAYNWSDANSMFPDLDRIATSGLATHADLRGEKDWVPSIPKYEQNAFKTVSSDCIRSANMPIRNAGLLWYSLRSSWINTDAKGDSDPKYLQLVEQFGRCIKNHGYEGLTPSEFLLGVDKLRLSVSQSERASIELRAGKVYAQCYRAANNYRQKFRLKARTLFMNEHAVQIQAAQRQLNASVARLSKISGVAYGHK
jgi:hypothetical protein